VTIDRNLDATQVEELRAKQLEHCPAALENSLIITGFQEDAAAKATFFTVESEGRDGYSQLLELTKSTARSASFAGFLRRNLLATRRALLSPSVGLHRKPGFMNSCRTRRLA
jgi:hypothetical protein